MDQYVITCARQAVKIIQLEEVCEILKAELRKLQPEQPTIVEPEIPSDPPE